MRPSKPSLTQHGFTMLELVVVIIIISIIGLVAVNRFWQWSAVAERASVQTVVGHLRTALGLETSRLALRQELSKLPAMLGSNPMELLAQTPDSYLGALDTEQELQQDGVWYFDTKHKLLVYRLRYPDGFESELDGAPRIRYRIKLVYSDNNRNGRFDSKVDDIGGLDLVPVEAYHWQPPQP